MENSSSPAQAKETQTYLDSAQGYAAKGNYKAAEIELRNAAREAPQDAHVHALLSQVYLKLGDLKWRPYQQIIERLEGGPAPVEREMITPRDLAAAEQLERVAGSDSAEEKP